MFILHLFHVTGSRHSIYTNLPPFIILQTVDFTGVRDNQSPGESAFLVYPRTTVNVLLLIQVKYLWVLLIIELKDTYLWSVFDWYWISGQ